ncbi:hypothetical protein [Oleiagrimonas sp. C23AA]|uniref:hypothetical protein n=1 Tax=Oleiagrimonas sp. C23AA TaxID=2719047 RepID=UPI001421AD89|nr:hypothetical protein [Oleiagrimonas sp. C23AA]NII10091.1 hypothetical protein [Oleiagrimonas sp. C23AA]
MTAVGGLLLLLRGVQGLVHPHIKSAHPILGASEAFNKGYMPGFVAGQWSALVVAMVVGLALLWIALRKRGTSATA